MGSGYSATPKTGAPAFEAPFGGAVALEHSRGKNRDGAFWEKEGNKKKMVSTGQREEEKRVKDGVRSLQASVCV